MFNVSYCYVVVRIIISMLVILYDSDIVRYDRRTGLSNAPPDMEYDNNSIEIANKAHKSITICTYQLLFVLIYADPARHIAHILVPVGEVTCGERRDLGRLEGECMLC